MNLYSYVAGQPTGLTDPTGLIAGTGKYDCCGVEKGGVPWKHVVVQWRQYFASTTSIAQQFASATSIWQQCCIKVVNGGGKTYDQSSTESILGSNHVLDLTNYRNIGDVAKISSSQPGADNVYGHWVKQICGRRGKTPPGYAFAEWAGWAVPPAHAFAIGNGAGGRVMPHELGHVLGLRHVSDKSNVMYRGAPVGSTLTPGQCDTARTHSTVKASQ